MELTDYPTNRKWFLRFSTIGGIERNIAGEVDGEVVALDFPKIGIVDFSCTDDVVAKLDCIGIFILFMRVCGLCILYVRLASIVCYKIMSGDNSCWQPKYAQRAESIYAG